MLLFIGAGANYVNHFRLRKPLRKASPVFVNESLQLLVTDPDHELNVVQVLKHGVLQLVGATTAIISEHYRNYTGWPS